MNQHKERFETDQPITHQDISNRMRLLSVYLVAFVLPIVRAFSLTASHEARVPLRTQTALSAESEINRRQILFRSGSIIASSVALSSFPSVVTANDVKINTISDGNLPDLPTEASRSYLQYRIPLQIAADFFIFELQPKLANVDDWGEINVLFQTNNARAGQGSPNKIERDFTNPMRILGLSMPPDEAEEMRAAQFKFEAAMQKISRAVSGIRRDLPVEIDPSAVGKAQDGWEEGRLALNDFFVVLNKVTGLNEMKVLPKADEIDKYGRSQRKYFELMKKTKLCQNRGGPALAQGWGQLMISGYMQDSCGIPDLDKYFYQ